MASPSEAAAQVIVERLTARGDLGSPPAEVLAFTTTADGVRVRWTEPQLPESSSSGSAPLRPAMRVLVEFPVDIRVSPEEVLTHVCRLLDLPQPPPPSSSPLRPPPLLRPQQEL